MHIDVDSRFLARKGVLRLQGILDWCAGQEWVAPASVHPALDRRHRLQVRPLPSLQISLLNITGGPEKGETAKPAPASGGRTHGKTREPRAPKSKEPLNQVQTVFLHFIATGVLPASHGGYTLATMERQLAEELQKDPHFFGAPSGGSVFSYQLLDLLLTNRTALPRLLSQFGEALLEDLYAHTMESGIVSRWTSWLSDVPGLDTRTLRWKALLLSLSYTGGRISLDNYSKVEKGIVLYLLRDMQPAQLFRWVGQLPSVKLEKLLGALDIPFGADLSEVLSIIQEQTGHLVPPQAPGLEGTAATPVLPPDAGVYIDNAGLVLLHPFLFSLFQELGWVDGIGFVQETLQQRAVLLTQSLAHASDIHPEYQLRLNKLLCGYPLEDTLPLSLDDENGREHAKVNQLLETVLRQWTINGQPVNPNVSALRDAWIRRRGKLIRREHDWVLQVEQKAFDVVLLNSLSWNTRMIQLPWMREVLWVEWV